MGALQGQRARKGVFITTSSYTAEAVDYASRIDTKVVLIDGAQLAGLMMDFDVGVLVSASYVVKRVERLAGGVVLAAGIFLFDQTQSGEAESGVRVGLLFGTAWARL